MEIETVFCRPMCPWSISDSGHVIRWGLPTRTCYIIFPIQPHVWSNSSGHQLYNIKLTFSIHNLILINCTLLGVWLQLQSINLMHHHNIPRSSLPYQIIHVKLHIKEKTKCWNESHVRWCSIVRFVTRKSSNCNKK